VIDTATNTLTTTITVGNSPTAVAITPNGKYAYVSNSASVATSGDIGGGSNGTVSVISTDTNEVVTTVTVERNPGNLAITTDGKYAYVANLASNSVSVIDTATNTITKTITGFSGPNGLAITPNDEYAYFTNGANATVLVINTATNDLSATITVGTNPYSIAFTPDGTYAYVTNSYSGTVSVINTATNTVPTDSSTPSSPEFPMQVLIISILVFTIFIVIGLFIAVTVKKKLGRNHNAANIEHMF
jgi:YVTN family beta-propeller protein